MWLHCQQDFSSPAECGVLNVSAGKKLLYDGEMMQQYSTHYSCPLSFSDTHTHTHTRTHIGFSHTLAMALPVRFSPTIKNIMLRFFNLNMNQQTIEVWVQKSFYDYKQKKKKTQTLPMSLLWIVL